MNWLHVSVVISASVVHLADGLWDAGCFPYCAPHRVSHVFVTMPCGSHVSRTVLGQVHSDLLSTAPSDLTSQAVAKD